MKIPGQIPVKINTAILIDAFDGIDWLERCLEWNFMVLSGVP